MNCKPGDTAFVIRTTEGHPCVASCIGTPVVCQELSEFNGQPFWLTKSLTKCLNCGGFRFGFLDADLQPIRGQQQGTSTKTEKPVEVAA